MKKEIPLFNKLQAAWEKTEPFRTGVSNVFEKITYVLGVFWKWIYMLRSVLLSIPVVIAAVWMALQALVKLPEQVGILLLETGEFHWMVTRQVAAFGPLAVTAACLLMMFCSRRVLYPWLISIFSLVIPFVIYITNVFPA